jgi:putative iron-regulated protein
MRSKNYIYITFVLVLLLMGVVGCSDDDGPTDPVDNNEQTFAKIITDYADLAVVATYHDLMNNAESLNASVSTFQTASTQANINAACEAWKSTREPWESSEAFLFGPVAFLGLDPSMDSWPLDQAQLEEVLSSDFELSPEFIRDGLGASLRGFHTVEFLLFRNGSPRNAEDVTEREKEYLVAVTQVLFEDTETLYNEWAGGYRDEYVNAGGSGSRYISQEQALQEIVEGIILIADEVGNGKIGDPYTSKDVLSVESWFSWNSLTDYKNNINSIENAYTGGYHNGTNGTGLDEFVAEQDAQLDARVKLEIKAAYNAINAIPEPYRNNLNADVQIQAAITACNTLVNTFEEDVKTLITY